MSARVDGEANEGCSLLVGREGERVRRTRRDQRRSEGRKERIAIVGKVGCNDFRREVGWVV